MYRPLAEPGIIYQGLTGVLRDYRGRGIAMALKVRTVRYARANGYREIRTWNDVRNRKMLRINDALGFAKQPASINYVKTLAP
jgi:GNAT superfamily N-acetyltransferase